MTMFHVQFKINLVIIACGQMDLKHCFPACRASIEYERLASLIADPLRRAAEKNLRSRIRQNSLPQWNSDEFRYG
jgi:hypothetical protein